jgi:hypothetical protein
VDERRCCSQNPNLREIAHKRSKREERKKIERKERKGLAKPFSNTIVLFQNYFGWLGFNSNKKRRGGLL